MKKYYICVVENNDKSINVEIVPVSSEIIISFNITGGKTQSKFAIDKGNQDKINENELKHKIDSWPGLIIINELDKYNSQWEDWSNWIILN
ncbi:MAG: hypothetical protein P8X73_14410 [Ignavibacteriaceae bacterium]